MTIEGEKRGVQICAAKSPRGFGRAADCSMIGALRFSRAAERGRDQPCSNCSAAGKASNGKRGIFSEARP